jgi:hypothetical protein
VNAATLTISDRSGLLKIYPQAHVLEMKKRRHYIYTDISSELLLAGSGNRPTRPKWVKYHLQEIEDTHPAGPQVANMPY